MDKSPPSPPEKPASAEKAARQARLAAALRTNLRRRKAAKTGAGEGPDTEGDRS